MKPSHRAETTLRDYKRRLLRVLVHIQQHLSESLELSELATLACFSPCHFHRVFTGMIGESVKEHVRRLRLERAAVQLKLGAQPVTQIALSAGYETHESFTRAFKVAYGLPPSRYRDSKRSPVSGDAPSGVRYRLGKLPSDFKARQTRGTKMNVSIKTLEPMRVAFLRHVGPYQAVGDTWEKLLPILGKEGLLGGDSQFLGLCHDDPDVTPPDKLRYDACVTVDAGYTPMGDLGVQTVPGGDYAFTTHEGPYEQLGTTYRYLFGQWLPRSGRELRSSPCFEIYLNSPENTAPEDLISDVYVPLEPQGTRPVLKGQL